jgi:hypothetical protein
MNIFFSFSLWSEQQPHLHRSAITLKNYEGEKEQRAKKKALQTTHENWSMIYNWKFMKEGKAELHIGVTLNIFIICSRINVCNLLMKNVQCRRHNSQKQEEKKSLLYLCEWISADEIWMIENAEDEDFRWVLLMVHPFNLTWMKSIACLFMILFYFSSLFHNQPMWSILSAAAQQTWNNKEERKKRWKAQSEDGKKYYVLRQILYHLWYSYHNNTYNVDFYSFTLNRCRRRYISASKASKKKKERKEQC